jgi:prepilin-type N-terminal cleavage/methylation domain-containing protein
MKRQVKHPMDSLWLVLCKASKPRSKSSGGGFTLIESLVAIIIVSITVVAISPPIFWATGTRVQNRRAEQALSIAQATIDQVRARVERGGSTALELPAIDTGATAGKRPNPAGPLPSAQWTSMQAITPQCNTVSQLKPSIAAVPATGTTAAVPAVAADKQYPDIGQYLPVMTTNDSVCKPDFLVQVFRNDGICANGIACSASALPANDRQPLVFSVGVRVYSAIAKNNGTTALLKEKAGLTGTTGTGQAGTRPLAVLYATVAKSDASASLNNYRALCKTGGTSCE